MLPDERLQEGVSPPLTESLAETSNVTTAPDGPVASTLCPLGRLSDGGVVSRTVTVKLAGVSVLFPARPGVHSRRSPHAKHGAEPGLHPPDAPDRIACRRVEY